MTPKKENLKVVTPQEIIRLHEQNVLNSLKTYNLNQSMFVQFPHGKRIPLLGRLGVWLVNKTGGTIATKYQFVGGTINSNSRRKK